MKWMPCAAVAVALLAGGCGGTGKPGAIPISTTPLPSVSGSASSTPAPTAKTTKVVYAAYPTDVAKTPQDLSLVAATVGACGDVETCGENFWQIQGNGARSNVETGAMKTVKLRGTNWFQGFTRDADTVTS